MRTGWVKPSVAVVVKVAITFGSVTGSNIWGFCEGDLVVMFADWGLGSSSETCACFVESIVECVCELRLVACESFLLHLSKLCGFCRV